MSKSFQTTRWTQVLAAQGDSSDSRAALSELCEAYYEPVYAFVRRSVRDLPSETARDLTHAFFAGLLASPKLETLERGRGRFRSYLLGAVKNFLYDHRDHGRAEKRGGGETPLSLDAPPLDTAESGGNTPPDPAALPAEEAFYDRQWALAVLARALGQLESEQQEGGRFARLKPWLNGDPDGPTRAQTAAALEISEDTLKVVIHRLRKRFRALIRAEVLQTVDAPEQVGAELDYLVKALGQAPQAG